MSSVRKRLSEKQAALNLTNKYHNNSTTKSSKEKNTNWFSWFVDSRSGRLVTGTTIIIGMGIFGATIGLITPLLLLRQRTCAIVGENNFLCQTITVSNPLHCVNSNEVLNTISRLKVSNLTLDEKLNYEFNNASKCDDPFGNIADIILNHQLRHKNCESVGNAAKSSPCISDKQQYDDNLIVSMLEQIEKDAQIYLGKSVLQEHISRHQLKNIIKKLKAINKKNNNIRETECNKLHVTDTSFVEYEKDLNIRFNNLHLRLLVATHEIEKTSFLTTINMHNLSNNTGIAASAFRYEVLPFVRSTAISLPNSVMNNHFNLLHGNLLELSQLVKQPTIVTQAPIRGNLAKKSSTICDFWLANYLRGSVLIVDLTDHLDQSNPVKWNRYFPQNIGEKLTYRKNNYTMTVTLDDENFDNQKIHHQHFSITMVDSKGNLHPNKEIQRINYRDWVDGQVINAKDLGTLIKTANKIAGIHSNLITVHCSAGIGRSGVFTVARAAEEIMHKYYTKTGITPLEFDTLIYELILSGRKQRNQYFAEIEVQERLLYFYLAQIASKLNVSVNKIN